ncbi:MAG: AGE family epimerase/isomerase [Cyclobacteriaceae bacterium]
MAVLLLTVCSPPADNSKNIADSKDSLRTSIANEMEVVFKNKMLDVWYPAFIDTTFGGYLSNFDKTWKADLVQNKFIVTQARHIWAISSIYEKYPELEDYPDFAKQGFQFLKSHMWDTTFGGFVQMVTREGDSNVKTFGKEKRAYGNAFAIYGLAALYRITGDPEVLSLAQESFYWLDSVARDKTHGGYFEHLNEDGSPIMQFNPTAGDAFTIGYKDYNSSIHILEAFAELYRVWPDQLLRSRLMEMFTLIKDTFMGEKAYLTLYFHPDWQPVSDTELLERTGGVHLHGNHITFGHDIETAFLLIEAAEVLQLPIDDFLLREIKAIVDRVLNYAWDHANGGIYERGKLINDQVVITDSSKVWWSQAEAMNSLLMLSELIPEKKEHYFDYFIQSWRFNHDNLIDQTNGGWYEWSIDTYPSDKQIKKAHSWKGTYHDGRSMLRCIHTLRTTHQ